MDIVLITAQRSNPFACEVYIDKALREMGHRIVADIDFRVEGECQRKLPEQADMVLAWKASYSPLTKPLYEKMEKITYPRVLWYPDCWEMGHTKHDLTKLHPFYDALYMVIPSDTEDFKKGWENKLGVRVLPPGVDSQMFAPQSEPSASVRTLPQYDIGFVGAMYAMRKKYLEFLSDNHLLIAYGEGFLHKDVAKLYNLSKMVFNHGITPRGVQLRVLEAMSCGRCLLTNRVPEGDSPFIDGHEIVYFDSEEELLSKVVYYMTHESEREWIGNNAREAILKGHTWKHRLETIFADLGVAKCAS